MKASQTFELKEALERVSHWLPTQGPIKDFIHHNTLHAFQHWPFFEGVRRAEKLFQAKGHLSFGEFRKLYWEDKIHKRALERSIQEELSDSTPKEVDQWMKNLTDPQSTYCDDLEKEANRNPKVKLRSHFSPKFQSLMDYRGLPTLYKLIGNFLDQGISIWPMPNNDLTFFEAISKLVDESFLPIPFLSSKECKALFKGSPEQAVTACLDRLVGVDAEAYLKEDYLLESLLDHPGWSGMAHMLEINPVSLLSPRKITLLQFTAVKLMIEVGVLSRAEGSSFEPVRKRASYQKAVRVESNSDNKLTEVERKLIQVRAMWQGALEWDYYEQSLVALKKKVAPEYPKRETKIQAYFCIDDRECGVRRYIDQIDPTIETFAWAGFFGIDYYFQGHSDAFPTQMCPVNIKPKHLVREWIDESQIKKKKKKKAFFGFSHFEKSSQTFVRGWLISQTLGFWSAFRLALSVLSPLDQASAEELSKVKAPTRLHLLREGDTVTETGLLLGYSYPEMADRVFGVLRGSGLTKDFADLVVFCAHGASSVNNPHFAAYDCGACSGRAGAPNARAIAWMANQKEVRKLVAVKGIKIPEDTWFVGALHNTTRDELSYFDTEEVPKSHKKLLDQFKKTMNQVVELNAKERSRRFILADPDLSNPSALREVKRRSVAIFEPRPELNHATNVLAIVGRRPLTQGISFDRRAFLNSYDPIPDTKGDVLAAILSAVVPVCGGINLEYYFSRTDNEVYGAGTKLPHNVTGLIGVTNGVEGDLRTGLPSQMIEVHDPLRLMVIVEQAPEIALSSVTRNPAVYEWIINDWVKFAAIDPNSGQVYFHKTTEKGGEMKLFQSLPQLPDLEIPTTDSWLNSVRGKSENLPVTMLAPNLETGERS